ncbi:MAG: hypothetical protein RMH77_06705 [Sulfolobales archaeon]|nr:hypothetical protein [Sulfolobales archaeon]MCX8185724.1 hypothetical protein [Sulfolobales archaeon]MDW7970068.1 hypothetical protein [Sulfolobales archaeon]
MVYVKEFSGFKEMLASLDEDILEIKRVLGELLRRMEVLRVRAENERALKDVLSKMGISQTQGQVSNVVNLKKVKVIIKPTTEQELISLEEFVEYLTSRMILLESIKKELSLFSTTNIEAKIEVIYVDGLPKEIYVK